MAILLLVAQGATYGLARRFGVGRGIATVAAVAYAFNGANIVFVHRVNAAFLYPLFLLVLDRAVEKPSVRRALAVGGVTAWIWLEGFPASTVHSIYLGALWVLWLLYRYIVRARAEGRLDWKQVAGRVAATGGGVAWGMALAAVNFVYFLQFISSIGLLDQRHQDSAGHLSSMFLFGTFSSGIYGNTLDPNDWWMGSNPVEAVTTIGGVAMVMGVVAVGLALAGRVRLTPRGRDVWPFLMASTLGLVVLTFIGTGLLGLTYAMPGLGDNPLTRIRFAIALPVVLLGALGADAYVRRRADGERPPLRSTVLWAVLVVCAFVLPADQFTDLAYSQGRVTEVARAVLTGLVLAGAVVALMVLAARRPSWRPALAVLAAALVWVDVALPLREFTPEAPVEDFYPETDGHRALQRLAGDEYRFAASGVDYYPNDATLHGLFDLRGATLRPERVKDFVRLADPEAFDRDYMKQLLARDEWNLASPVYDELSLRYFIVGTAMAPFGTPVRVTGQPGTATVPATEAAPVVTSVDLPEGTAGVGFVATASGDGCAAAELTVEARQGSEVRRTQRPAADAAGDWVDLGLVAQDLDPTPADRADHRPGPARLHRGGGHRRRRSRPACLRGGPRRPGAAGGGGRRLDLRAPRGQAHGPGLLRLGHRPHRHGGPEGLRGRPDAGRGDRHRRAADRPRLHRDGDGDRLRRQRGHHHRGVGGQRPGRGGPVGHGRLAGHHRRRAGSVGAALRRADLGGGPAGPPRGPVRVPAQGLLPGCRHQRAGARRRPGRPGGGRGAAPSPSTRRGGPRPVPPVRRASRPRRRTGRLPAVREPGGWPCAARRRPRCPPGGPRTGPAGWPAVPAGGG